ncbi:hypothetical protein CCR75_005735 [Bremia lactucae]|uniref:Endothelin-converting enzyme 1 n=1 Tax=Bremia lactucae TaxID=4779 RepID=A0A976FR44_BRELC|nr:hypothetical protein CCR75_005735 [Bremia lactucae]
MERGKGSKWTKVTENDKTLGSVDDNQVAQTQQNDEQPLVAIEEDSLGHAMPPAPLLQKPLAAWAVGGLVALFLLVVVLVVRSGILQTQQRVKFATFGPKWVDLLPSEVKIHMNVDIDPCHDFYEFSCGAWQAQSKIPDDKGSISLSFTTVHDANLEVLNTVMQQGWPLVGELYDSCMNFTTTSPAIADTTSRRVLEPALQLIAATTSKTELFQVAGYLSQEGPNFLTGLYVTADAKEATQYALYATQSGLSLPDPEYYLNKKHFESLREAFFTFVLDLFRLTGFETDAAASHATTVLAFEQLVAPLYVPKETLQDPVATYHRERIADTINAYPLLFGAFVNGTEQLARLVASNTDVIVRTPSFFTQTEQLVAGVSVTLDTLKAVLSYKYIKSKAATLSEPFVQASFAFHGKMLNGQQKRAVRWKVCVECVTNVFPDLVGKYFALVRTNDASEQLARDMVAQLQMSFHTALDHVDWLDASTRNAALVKLANMTNLIGHSMQHKHFPLELQREAPLATNLAIVAKYEFQRIMGRIGSLVDRTEWSMSSADVNAYYEATANKIVFPAGILQPPFFGQNRHPARNFGSIGSIIGHELTHGFDDSGRHYGGDGNLVDWWSHATATEFQERTSCLVAQYNRYQVNSSTEVDKLLGHVNGNYTLGENIADNGGVKLAFMAYHAFLAKKTRQLHTSVIDNTKEATRSSDKLKLPPVVADRLFYISFAQTFCSKKSDASAIKSLASDPHAPGRWRINGVASNSPDFTQAFSCPAGSTMNSKTKCQVW